MKKTLMQNYEMTTILYVEVPDDWTDEQIQDYFTDFPIMVKVNPEFSKNAKGVKVELVLDGVDTTGRVAFA